MRNKFLLFVIGLPLVLARLASAEPLQYFPLTDVRLLESPFLHAQNTDIDYILAMNPDALLAPYLREAGLEPRHESYGNWESSGLDGHMGGHYLTALSLAYASTGNQLVKQRLDYFLSELARAQKANKNGYIGGIPGSSELWEAISKGTINASNFNLNDRWVPLYNIHKIYAGLRDAYLIAGNDKALTILKGLMQWTGKLVKNLSDDQIQAMLVSEHGGLNEVFADYYQISGDKYFLQLAKQFSHKRLLMPLLQQQDKLNGLHANTQIPKVVGFARIAQLTSDKQWFDAANFFWNVVVKERSVAIGGNSVSEHFHPKDDFSSMVESIQGPETCNTYNMLKLSKILNQQQPSTDYVDFYERALYNHILSSQHPETGGLVYFTPMRPQHYRVYSQVETSMWCCVGSGIENHVKYGEFIYAHQNNDLIVNLFIPSRVNWREKGVTLRQENTLPDTEQTTIVIEQGGQFNLKIRQPQWLEGPMAVTLNGEKIRPKVNDSGYLEINRHWQAKDTLIATLPMATRVEGLPDDSAFYTVLHGPFVLASPVEKKDETLSYFADDSRMGHLAAGPQCPVSDAPVFLSEDKDIVSKLKRLPGKELAFSVNDIATHAERLKPLVPFFRVHNTRYMLYWRQTDKAGLQALKKEKAKQEAEKLALLEKTVDYITPGRQQPEVEHNFRGGRTESGVHRGKHWRHAYDWFSYELANPELQAKTLRLTFNGEDSGRTYDILINDMLITTVKATGAAGPVFVEKDYPLPDKLQRQKTLTIEFKAHEESMAGGIFGIRLLK